MLVDADKAKEKLAKALSDLGAHFTVIDTIRQTDLTDCMVEVGEDNDPEWNSLHCTCGASGVAVMAHEPHCAVILIESLSAQVAELQRSLADEKAVHIQLHQDALERASAAEDQVAELRRENERILKTHVVVMKEADAMRDELITQVAELKQHVLYKQCSKHEGTAFTFKAETVGYTKIVCPNCIDAAKESGNE